MRHAVEAAGPVLIAALLLVIGNGLLGTLTSLRLAEASGSAWMAGVVASAFFGGQMIGGVYGVRTLRAVGHIRAYAAFAAFAAIAAMLLPLLGAGWSWVALRFVFGVAIVGMFLAMESWLNATVRDDARGAVFSMYMVAVYGGLAVGQGPIAWLGPQFAVGIQMAAICVILSSVPITLTARAQPALDTMQTVSIFRIFRLSPTGGICAITAGALIGGGLGLGPVYAQAIGLDEAAVAAFMATFLIAGLVVSWPLGWLSDRIDRRLVIVAILFALAAAGAVGALTATGSQIVVFGLAAIFGICALPTYSLAVAHANDVMAGISPVATASGMLVGFGAGAMASPALIALAMDMVGAGAFPAALGLMALATGTFVVFRIKANEQPPADEKTPHHPLPRTTSMAYALDPWTAPEPAAEAPAAGDGGDGELAGDPASDPASEPAPDPPPGWRDAWIAPEPEPDPTADAPETPKSEDNPRP